MAGFEVTSRPVLTDNECDGQQVLAEMTAQDLSAAAAARTERTYNLFNPMKVLPTTLEIWGDMVTGKALEDSRLRPATRNLGIAVASCVAAGCKLRERGGCAVGRYSIRATAERDGFSSQQMPLPPSE